MTAIPALDELDFLKMQVSRANAQMAQPDGVDRLRQRVGAAHSDPLLSAH